MIVLVRQIEISDISGLRVRALAEVHSGYRKRRIESDLLRDISTPSCPDFISRQRQAVDQISTTLVPTAIAFLRNTINVASGTAGLAR